MSTSGQASQTHCRYVVGIDLGTTNTVVAYADTHKAPAARSSDPEDDGPPPRPIIEVFAVPQLVAPGQVEARQQFPSFRYHPTEEELSEADLALADSWACLPTSEVARASKPVPRTATAVDGVLAQTLGARVPGRLISSAKSWLCHAGIDREADVLPWGADKSVPKVSPVEASARYLAHVRSAWDAAHPGYPLADQQVVLTVPASFDEAARSLTLKAARQAGLPKLRLQEEPQAAFYDWLDRHADRLEVALGDVKLVLVIDAGGGTTDLSLIRAQIASSGPTLTRIAVGEHLLLGGDNMDHALAHLCESELASSTGRKLPATRFAQLLQQCRKAKQTLLSTDAPEQVTLTLLGGGSSIMAGRASVTLSRQQVEETLTLGFLPTVEMDARPSTRRSGLVEFGLPYAADPVITKHVAAFLARHQAQAAHAPQPSDAALPPQAASETDGQPALSAMPDGVLFNGGVFCSPVLERRMRDALEHLTGAPVTRLDGGDPNLAVARGAVAYGLSRRGIGLKIGGGSPRSYYLKVRTAQDTHDAVCILPRGTEEGQEHALGDSRFALRVGHPVRFELHTSTAQPQHRPNDLVTTDDGYDALPDLCAVIERRPDDTDELSVQLHAQLTEVGTLEMSLVSVDDPSRRYRLEFQLRGERRTSEATATSVGELHPRFREATALVQLFYGKAQKSLDGRKVNTLRGELEKTLGARAQWETPLLRELFTALLAAAKRRRRSAAHERVWFGLIGYCLRPGFGYPLDDWRVDQLWPLYEQGVQFSPEAAVWTQYWIVWRRVSGGLNSTQQRAIYDDLAFDLNPDLRKRGPRPKGPKKQGLEEMVRLAASLERLDPDLKAQLGDWLLTRVQRGDISKATGYWSLGRLGTRALLYGSAHTVVAPAVAQRWVEQLLTLNLSTTDQAPFAVSQLCQLTNDRARDLDPAVRDRALAALAKLPGSAQWTQRIAEGGLPTESETSALFGESLPSGLRWIGDT